MQKFLAPLARDPEAQATQIMQPLRLIPLPEHYMVHRFAADAPLPNQVLASGVFHISRTPEELSVVCEAGLTLDSQAQFVPLAGLRVAGPLDFGLIGILAELTQQIADAKLSACAVEALRAAGHSVDETE